MIVSGRWNPASGIPGHHSSADPTEEAHATALGGGFPDTALLPRAGNAPIMPHIPPQVLLPAASGLTGPCGRQRLRAHKRSLGGARTWAHGKVGQAAGTAYRGRGDPCPCTLPDGWPGVGYPRPEARELPCQKPMLLCIPVKSGNGRHVAPHRPGNRLLHPGEGVRNSFWLVMQDFSEY